MAIFIKQGDTLIEMTERPYDAEAVLQQLLADHPNLLAGDVDGEQRKRLLLIQREMGVPSEAEAGSRWSLDHLFIDEDSVPILVEVKRSSDTRIRREVVGQMLDYAANASSYWRVDALREAFESACRDADIDPDETVESHMTGDADVERFWQDVDTNLKAGRLRLVFVADEIPSELRRIVEFLNEQMTRTDVLALEVRQYVAPGENMITLVPRLIGQTQAARDVKRTTTGRVNRRWGESDVLNMWPEHNAPEIASRVRRLYKFMQGEGARASWGTGVLPSVNVWLGEREDAATNPVAIGMFSDNMCIWFDFVRRRRTEAENHRLAAAMRSIPNVARYTQGLEQQDFGMHPGMKYTEVLASEEALEAWKEALKTASAPALST